MSQSESTSDSDSNTSSSWVFVDECISDNEMEKNKYYLNCSTEPVQELTPQCLNSINSEQETDSDGISVISESEDFKDHLSVEEQPMMTTYDDPLETYNVPVEIDNVPRQTNDVPIETIISHEESIDVKGDFYFNKFIIVGWVLIAIITPILLNYFTTYKDDTPIDKLVVDFPKKDINSYKSLETVTSINVLDIEHKSDEDSNQILSNQIYGVADHSKIDIKKKYESKGEADIHRLDCKNGRFPCEEYKMLNPKEKNKNEQIIKEDITGIKEKNKKPVNSNTMKSHNKNKKKNKETKQILEKEHFKSDKTSKIERRDMNKYDTKEHRIKKKSKNKSKESKHRKKEETNNNEYKGNPLKKKIKKIKKSLRKKDKEIKELTKLIKIKDKQLKFLEYKVLKELNILRKHEVLDYPKIVDYKGNRNNFNGTTADWYYKLHEGRTWLRNQQHVSDWIFNRAEFRKQRRNIKNNWYWNWMANREELRLKKGFWQFTY